LRQLPQQLTGIVNGGVRKITLTNRGSGYTSVPRVAISSSPSGGLTAVGIATMISGIIDCNGIVSDKIQGVEIINPGYGYTVAPGVSFIGGGGVGAAATTEIADGIIGIITDIEWRIWIQFATCSYVQFSWNWNNCNSSIFN
jgi:hypothetical protein